MLRGKIVTSSHERGNEAALEIPNPSFRLRFCVLLGTSLMSKGINKVIV